ncbi:MAG: hypothetical protein NVS9B10_25550 [Nevskia sp.]
MRSSDDRRPSSSLRLRALAAALTPLALSACVGTPEGFEPGRGATVEVRELRRAGVCNSRSGAASVTLLNDLDALKAWQQAQQVDLVGEAPLAPGPYALVEHGARNTGGYAVVVGRRAFVGDGVLYLNASFLAPIGDALRPAMLTSPCALIALPVGNYGVVELRDPQGRRRATSNAPPLPSPALAAPAQ